MKIRDLFEFKFTINNLYYSMIRPKYPLTNLIIKGYLSFLTLDEIIQEGRFPKGKYKGSSNKIFEYKVTFMKQHLDKIIRIVDSFVDEIPDLIEGRNVKFGHSTVHFVKSFMKYLKYLKLVVMDNESSLTRTIRMKMLDETNIKKFKKINHQIKKFNSLLTYMEKVFKFDTLDRKGKELNIVFNEDEKEIYNLLMRTLEQKLPLLNIPKKPIEENRKYNIDVEI